MDIPTNPLALVPCFLESLHDAVAPTLPDPPMDVLTAAVDQRATVLHDGPLEE